MTAPHVAYSADCFGTREEMIDRYLALKAENERLGKAISEASSERDTAQRKAEDLDVEAQRYADIASKEREYAIACRALLDECRTYLRESCICNASETLAAKIDAALAKNPTEPGRPGLAEGSASQRLPAESCGQVRPLPGSTPSDPWQQAEDKLRAHLERKGEPLTVLCHGDGKPCADANGLCKVAGPCISPATATHRREYIEMHARATPSSGVVRPTNSPDRQEP
jgi:hypothetical protein